MKKTLFVSFLAILLCACSQKEDDEVVPVQRIDSISATFFPNPTKGDVIITFNEVYTQVKVEITDINGEVVSSIIYKNTDTIELFIEQPIGVYILNLTHISGVKMDYKIVRV